MATNARVTRVSRTALVNGTSAGRVTLTARQALVDGTSAGRVTLVARQALVKQATFATKLYDPVNGVTLTNAGYRAEIYDQSGPDITGAPAQVVTGTSDGSGNISIDQPSAVASTVLMRIVITSDPDHSGAAVDFANDDVVTFT